MKSFSTTFILEPAEPRAGHTYKLWIQKVMLVDAMPEEKIKKGVFAKLPHSAPKLVDPLDCLMLLSAEKVKDETLPHSRQLTPGPLPARRCSKEQLSRAFLRSTKLIFLSDLWVPIQLFRPSMRLWNTIVRCVYLAILVNQSLRFS